MEEGNYYINSIIRAVDILELYSHDRSELGISEIAKELNLYKSTVHRIVSTLEYKRLLEQNPQSGKYKLGVNLYKLGSLAQNASELLVVSAPYMQKLTEITGETSSLVVLEGTRCIYLAQHESSHIVKMIARVGARILPHCSASGKILLSELEECEVQKIIDANGLARFTSETITTKERLMEELKKTRELGYAIDNQEREEGVMCVAMPIRDSSKKITAAISVSGPRDRINPHLESIIISAKDCVRQISYKLGYNNS